MNPFIKWAGSKRQLIDRLVPEICKGLGGGRYIEPFLGGGAVALALPITIPKIVADVCEPLVETWQTARRAPEELARRLRRLEARHSKEFYYATRAALSLGDAIDRAAKFIYLNKAGFNGLWRVNKAGAFNVPLGRLHCLSLPDTAQLIELSSRTSGWSITCQDFEDVIAQAEAGDVVFADPPYDGTFGYSAGFTSDDRRRLSVCLAKAVSRGASVIATDADTPLVRDLYCWARVESISERRRVAASAERRGDAACVIVTS